MESQDDLRRFEQAVLPHMDAAYNLARWLVRDPSTAEDVVQDAALRAWKYFASLRGGSERPWLLQIVRNTAYSCIRQQHRAGEVSLTVGTNVDGDECADLELADPQPGPEASLAHRQDLAALDGALDALPIALRECLVLREVELLSYKEIARVTGVPIGTVMSRLSRARQVLRGCTGDGAHVQRKRDDLARSMDQGTIAAVPE
jgi:RNA polymerase sigma-70 factor (ECF subfamily)